MSEAATQIEQVPAPKPEKPPGFLKFFLSAPFKVKLQLLFIQLVGFSVLGGSMAGIIFLIKAHFGSVAQPHIEEKKEEHAVHDSKAPQPNLTLELKNMSFSIMDHKRLRNAFVQFSLIIECDSETCMRMLEMYRAKLIDMIYEVSSGFYVEDFLDPKGSQKFKKLLHEGYQDFFKENAPKSIAIKEWVMN